MNQGSFGVVTKDKKILLVKLPPWDAFGEHWNFPGGLVEPGEELEIAAKREVKEETDIDCQIGALLHTVENHDHNITVYIFKATYLSGDIKHQEEELTDAGWFTIAEALKLPLAYNIREILETFVAE